MKSLDLFYQEFIKKYSSFKGTVSVNNYWKIVFIYYCIYFSLYSFSLYNENLVFVSLVFSLLTIIPGISLAVRRLHDIGKSGKYLFLIIIPVVNLYLIYLLCRRGNDEVKYEYKFKSSETWQLICIALGLNLLMYGISPESVSVPETDHSEVALSEESLDKASDVINLTSPSGIKWTITAIMNDFSTSYKVNSKFGDIASLTDKKNSLEFDIRDFDYNEAKLFLKIGADGYGKAMQSRLLVIDLNTGEFENEYGNADTHAIKLDKKYGIATFYDFDNNKISEIAYI